MPRGSDSGSEQMASDRFRLGQSVDLWDGGLCYTGAIVATDRDRRRFQVRFERCTYPEGWWQDLRGGFKDDKWVEEWQLRQGDRVRRCSGANGRWRERVRRAAAADAARKDADLTIVQTGDVCQDILNVCAAAQLVKSVHLHLPPQPREWCCGQRPAVPHSYRLVVNKDGGFDRHDRYVDSVSRSTYRTEEREALALSLISQAVTSWRRRRSATRAPTPPRRRRRYLSYELIPGETERLFRVLGNLELSVTS